MRPRRSCVHDKNVRWCEMESTRSAACFTRFDLTPVLTSHHITYNFIHFLPYPRQATDSKNRTTSQATLALSAAHRSESDERQETKDKRIMDDVYYKP
jgi:hypothetical protein